MTKDIIATIGTGVALAALMVGGQQSTNSRLDRLEMHVGDLRERIARIETKLGIPSLPAHRPAKPKRENAPLLSSGCRFPIACGRVARIRKALGGYLLVLEPTPPSRRRNDQERI